MNCLIYPYHDLLFPIAEKLAGPDGEYRITDAVYPAAWTKKMKHSLHESGIALHRDFHAALAHTEGVILADAGEQPYMYQDILRKARAGMQAGKSVICCTDIRKEDLHQLKAEYPDADFRMLYQNTGSFKPQIYNRHEQLRCITVGVGSLYRGLDSIPALTLLTNEFRQIGYRVTAAAYNETGRLLGYLPYPKARLDAEPDIERRPELLNNYFASLAAETECDIMLIQFPDGLMKLADYSADSYGIQDYILTRALTFDYFLLVSHLGMDVSAYSLLRGALRDRYGLSLDACAVQDVTVDTNLTSEYRTLCYTQNGIEQYAARLGALTAEYEDICFSALDDAAGYHRIAEHCIRKFT